MIAADDVETLLFDVLGTVVDEAGSMRADLASPIREGPPWRSADHFNSEALADVLRDGPGGYHPASGPGRLGTGSGPGPARRPR